MSEDISTAHTSGSPVLAPFIVLSLKSTLERSLISITMTTEPKDATPMNIATISAGFEKGDFLVREEQGNRVYFDFFEEVRGPTTALSCYLRLSCV